MASGLTPALSPFIVSNDADGLVSICCPGNRHLCDHLVQEDMRTRVRQVYVILKHGQQSLGPQRRKGWLQREREKRRKVASESKTDKSIYLIRIYRSFAGCFWQIVTFLAL